MWGLVGVVVVVVVGKQKHSDLFGGPSFVPPPFQDQFASQESRSEF